MLSTVMNLSDCDQKNRTSTSRAMTIPLRRDQALALAMRGPESMPTVLAGPGPEIEGVRFSDIGAWMAHQISRPAYHPRASLGQPPMNSL